LNESSYFLAYLGYTLHQHEGCRKSARPTSKVEFWNEKLDKNMVRDFTNMEFLKKAGWTILTVWDCELMKNNTENFTKRLTGGLQL
jgi:DNA mismatch endonuclease (patch repair protein)